MSMLYNKYKDGWLVFLGLSFLPILLWLMAPSPVPRFGDSTASLASIGQLLGLTGAAMFGLNLILSARLRIIEKHFFGLDRVYRKHNQLGQLAFVLLLFHPLFLIPKYATSLYQAALFLLPGANWPVNWGLAALTTMIFLIVLTLFVKLRYHIWKWTHKFLGLAFFLAGLHI